MIRRTKVVATLGPASSDAKTLARMIAAGLDVVRINFSHGTPDEHRARVNLVRTLARKAGRAVGVLVDLQGPKIRIGKFRDNKITLAQGAKFVLDAECKLGNQDVVGLDYKNLPNDVRPGDTLLLDDGRIVLGVASVRGPRITTVVEQGGPLSNNKGINRKGGGLTAPALTDKDKQDIKLAAELKADFLGVSFPRSGDDVRWARDLLKRAGGHGLIVSKIERAEAIPALEEILDASDAIMVARGDLAVEVGDAVVPALQKKMIRMARDKQKLTITATQMMESMIENPVPTRAEVLDVANAVMDGTDAVMLSAETSVGAHPVRVVETVARICLGAERYPVTERSAERMSSHFDRSDETIAMAAMYVARNAQISAAVALTDSGHTALLLSRLLHGVPIFAMTEQPRTRRRLALARGVTAVEFDRGALPYDQVARDALARLKERGLLDKGQRVLITKGDRPGTGHTNTLMVLEVG